ncbi:hypothetical protein O3M35_000179 [Rhynocoris fuscipes]|uniref:Zinc finger protein n=1 Tax=Rhynocoris fuscipes TaxID=488301 RepID=A0AAW1DKS9_9HEMI
MKPLLTFRSHSVHPKRIDGEDAQVTVNSFIPASPNDKDDDSADDYGSGSDALTAHIHNSNEVLPDAEAIVIAQFTNVQVAERAIINQTLVTNSNNNMSANVVTSTNSRGRGRGRGQRKETNFDSSSSNNNTINTGVMFSQPVHAGSRARGRGRGRREMIDSNQTGANTSVPSNVALSAYKNAPSHNSFSSAGFNPMIPMTQSSMIPIPFINPLIPEYNFGAMPNVMLPLTSSTNSSNISTVFLSMTMMPVT